MIEQFLLTTLTSSRKKRVTVLEEAICSIVIPLRNCTEPEFEVSWKDWKIWGYFVKLASYCCDIPNAEDMSSVEHGTCSYKLYVRCPVRIQYLAQARESPDRLLLAANETRGSAQKCERACRDGDGRRSKLERVLGAERDNELVVRVASGKVALGSAEHIQRETSGD